MPFDIPHPVPVGDLQILLDARDRISDREAWLKQCFKDGDRHCLVAALSLACESRSFNAPNRTERRLARLLARQIPPESPWWTRSWFVSARHCLMWFNDHPLTTHADVSALFDRTILALASKVSDHVLA